MKLEDANELLASNPHALEDGYWRLDNGIGLVAARTPMPGCNGKMVEWWFSHVNTTEQYKQWHPGDHVFSAWRGERDTGNYIGGTHHVHEKLGSDKVVKLKINFRDPEKILDTNLFAQAGVSAAIYARGGPLNLPFWTAHLLHLIHDTEDGCVMRSRFWLGYISPALPLIAPAIRRDITAEAAIAGLHRHCHEEMNILASFLPGLYRSREIRPESISPGSDSYTRGKVANGFAREREPFSEKTICENKYLERGSDSIRTPGAPAAIQDGADQNACEAL